LKIGNSYKIKSSRQNSQKRAINIHLRRIYRIWPILIKTIKMKFRMNIQSKIAKSKVIILQIKKELAKLMELVKLKKMRL